MIPDTIVIHHSASLPLTSLDSIDRWHKDRGFTKSSLGFYIGYHYVIFPSGLCRQTRRDNELGCHTIPNDGKIGICLVGDFTYENPTAAQLASLSVLCRGIKKEYNIKEVKGHRDFANTECPGDQLYLFVLEDKINWLRSAINLFLKSLCFHV